MNNAYCDQFHQWLEDRNPGQPEFIQAVKDVTEDIYLLMDKHPEFQEQQLLYRLAEPDRIISFRVTWQDDSGEVRVNRGWRVQHNGAIGPYKGGIRFHPHVNESVLKFLAFEQTFKNALTGLPIGGGKGGANFDSTGCSENEIMRFCQAFMSELYRHIGENTDIPAGDINVGQREIGYLFGQYRRLSNKFAGALTGKDIEFGGSEVRLEATGFGLVYFVEEMLAARDETLDGKRIAISGAGNVALHAAHKACEEGAKIITLSSSRGVYHNPDGINPQLVKEALDDGKFDSTEVLKDMADRCGGKWHDGGKPWQFECDIALPCATQNELDEDDAAALIDQSILLIAEGANMPCTAKATKRFCEAGILHAPGKASNAGGVALSGLEMTQNASFTQMGYEELDRELKTIMREIHRQCMADGEGQNGQVDYHLGANIAAFKRVASAILAQGVI
jgi:glutamate dehydrogenase (NADP+)